MLDSCSSEERSSKLIHCKKDKSYKKQSHQRDNQMAIKLNEGGDGVPVNERLIVKDANNYDSLLQKRIVAVQ